MYEVRHSKLLTHGVEIPGDYEACVSLGSTVYERQRPGVGLQ